MAWIILIISFFIHTLSAYAMGDVVVHALAYDVTKGVVIGNAAILLACILVRLFLDKFLITTGAGKRGTAGVDCIMYVIGTVLAGVILELNFHYEMSQGLVMTLLFLILMIMAEKDLYLGLFMESAGDGTEQPDHASEIDGDDSVVEKTADISLEDEGESRAEEVHPEGQDEYFHPKGQDEIIYGDDDDDEVVLTFVDVDPLNKQNEENEELQTTENLKTEQDPTKTITPDGKTGNDGLETANAEGGARGEGTDEKSGALTSRDIIYIVFFGIGCLAFITLGILTLITIRLQDTHYGLFAGMVVAAAAAVIFRQLGRSLAPDEEEETVPVDDADSWDYWEAQERAEMKHRKSSKVNGILFGILAVLTTVLLCFTSMFVGLVYLLGAFLVAVIIPMCFYRWGVGGTEVVHAKTDRISRLVSRVFMVLILLIATWQLSYGALWETEFLLILAVTCTTQDYLARQNR